MTGGAKIRSVAEGLRTALLCAATCAVLGACGAKGVNGVVRIVPKALDDSAGAASTALEADRAEAGIERARITIDPEYSIVQILNVNLDKDPDEEQVIAVKKISDVGSPVRLIVVDADPERGTYYFASWETDTSATDARVFSLAAKDVVGDHSIQIVASGMTESGKLTLDVFRLLPPSQGKGLVYKPVCQLVADEINVEETERPDGYATDPKPGASFPIVAYLRDTESRNVMDLVRILYSWSPAEGRYVPGAAEKIPGAQVQQAQLRALFTGSGEKAFEQFIAGSWAQVQTAASARGKDAVVSIIDFDPLGRKISLSSGNTQEVYIWRESYRTIYNSLRAIGENETVLQIQLMRTFFITVTDPNTITVTIIGNDSGESPSAAYTRVNDEIRQKLIDRPDAQVVLSPVVLAGRYTGTQGLSLDFQAPRLSWTDNTGFRTGTYVMFSLGGRTILTTRFKVEGGKDETTSWLVDYMEKKDPTAITRSLVLSPVQLTVNGFEEANGDDISLLQYLDLRKK